MNQYFNGTNNYQGDNNELPKDTPNISDDNTSSVNQLDSADMQENGNHQIFDATNTKNYQQTEPEMSPSNSHLKSDKGISKKGKVMMIFVLISTLIIFFDNFITSTDWFWELQMQAVMHSDEQLKLALETIKEAVVVINWIIVLVITIISIVFLIKDKKNQNNVRIYEWYIVAGVLHIFIGTVGLTPIIYSVATLVFAIQNKKNNKLNNLSVKTDNVLIVFSSILIAFIVFMFIAVQINLFDKIEKEVDEYQENNEVIIEDNDNSHTVTTFNQIIDDWGNDVTKNKSYKIQNVKLNNITASLYVDYTFKLENESPVATITLKHGDNELYTYTEKSKYFNLSYLNIYDNLILYGTRYCDSVDNGMCNKHLTYSQVSAFNKDDSISLYDNTTISQGEGVVFYNDTSVFLEDESVYADPYNDFRVYDINIDNEDIYFDTIVENYDDVFSQDYHFRDNNCNNPFWVSIDFDMQRTFKTKFIYNESYQAYELDELKKQSSIKYSDYCVNKDVLGF